MKEWAGSQNLCPCPSSPEFALRSPQMIGGTQKEARARSKAPGKSPKQ